MPHAKLPYDRCGRPHRYRTVDHATGCDADTWPHYHVTCGRCDFSWWQPQLFAEAG